MYGVVGFAIDDSSNCINFCLLVNETKENAYLFAAFRNFFATQRLNRRGGLGRDPIGRFGFSNH
jgi:hypothetical protein